MSCFVVTNFARLQRGSTRSYCFGLSLSEAACIFGQRRIQKPPYRPLSKPSLCAESMGKRLWTWVGCQTSVKCRTGRCLLVKKFAELVSMFHQYLSPPPRSLLALLSLPVGRLKYTLSLLLLLPVHSCQTTASSGCTSLRFRAFGFLSSRNAYHRPTCVSSMWQCEGPRFYERRSGMPCSSLTAVSNPTYRCASGAAHATAACV